MESSGQRGVFRGGRGEQSLVPGQRMTRKVKVLGWKLGGSFTGRDSGR